MGDSIMECCANCRYSTAVEEQDDVLECRRFPPVFVGNDGDLNEFWFSATEPHKWCGEWSGKETM